MNVAKTNKRALLSWLFAVVLVGLCATLGVIQYRWIGEVSLAEHDRLRSSLQTSLQRISEDFDAEIRSTCAALSTESSAPDSEEREHELALHYARWRSTSRYSGLVRRLGIAQRGEDSLSLQELDLARGTFAPAQWPAEWTHLRDRLVARAFGDPGARMESFGFSNADELSLIELPQFVRREAGFGPDFSPIRAPAEFGWTVIELDLDYLRSSLLPELLQRYLGAGEKPDYQAEIVATDYPSSVIYDSGPNRLSTATLHSDASIELFRSPFNRMSRPRQPGRGPGPPPGREMRAGPDFNRGRWLLSVRHRTGSLEALVQQARRRNLAVTGAILLLMLAASGALLQFSRRAQRLAELQMEFVAGVSHELRTPLSVIRTAAHNLRVRVIGNPNQVQRYGSLIEEQSEKLADIVDRVLLFSNAKAGRVIQSKEVVDVDFLIEEALSACAKLVKESGCEVETHIEPGVPPVFGDSAALKHALLNLIGNASKYAADGRWIGITAASSTARKNMMVEIRVADHGPGIPRTELPHIFDPFYRGKMAVDDQIHGTGLGLSLVERIAKAHGGTVEVSSELGKGTEFVMRIPAAPAEQIDEFANSANRR
jgi:signal transduction histidine kinase